MYVDSQAELVRRFKRKSGGVSPLTAGSQDGASHVKAYSIGTTDAGRLSSHKKEPVGLLH